MAGPLSVDHEELLQLLLYNNAVCGGRIYTELRRFVIEGPYNTAGDFLSSPIDEIYEYYDTVSRHHRTLHCILTTRGERLDRRKRYRFASARGRHMRNTCREKWKDNNIRLTVENASKKITSHATTQGHRVLLQTLIRIPKLRLDATTILNLIYFVSYHNFQDLETLKAWDIQQVQQGVESCTRVKKSGRAPLVFLIRQIKTHPMMDPTGCFVTHTQYVPKTFLDCFPPLYHLDICVARCVQKIEALNDMSLIVELVTRFVKSKYRDFGDAIAKKRSIRSFCLRAVWFVSILQKVTSARDCTLHELIDRTLHRAAVLRAVAVTLGVLNATTREAVQYASDQNKRSLPTRQHVVNMYNYLIDHEWFTTAPFPRMTMAEVWQELNHQFFLNATALSTAIPVVSHRPKDPLTIAEVELIEAACIHPRERLLVCMLKFWGLRKNALRCILLGEVWDCTSNLPRKTAHLLEKWSKRRVVTISPEIERHLIEYVTEIRNRNGVLNAMDPLFTRNGRPICPAWHFSKIVGRSNLPTSRKNIHIHMFRAFLVNISIEQGIPLETISKYLGHKSPATTYSHYFTNAPDVAMRLFGPVNDDPREQEIQRLRDENQQLRLQLKNNHQEHQPETQSVNSSDKWPALPFD